MHIDVIPTGAKFGSIFIIYIYIIAKSATIKAGQQKANF
jgi:hypothetical protein